MTKEHSEETYLDTLQSSHYIQKAKVQYVKVSKNPKLTVVTIQIKETEMFPKHLNAKYQKYE